MNSLKSDCYACISETCLLYLLSKSIPLRKLINRTTFAIAIVLFTIACSKKDDPSPQQNSAIQQKWIFDSVVVYGNSNLTGASFFGMQGNNSDYFNFSSNGKLYTQMTGAYDSAKYRVQGDTILYLNTYYSGVLSSTTDTASIRVLTNNSLILVRKNELGEYGKFCFKR